jgi:hypothetical protein
MSLNMRTGFSCGVSSLFALVCASTTFAADRSLPRGAQGWMARDNCAAYGPGFTSGDSGQGCVKIGGHLRVEFGARGFSYYQYTTRATTTTAAIRTDNLAAGTSDLAESRHLRVRSDVSYGYDPFVEPTSSTSRASQ